MSLTPGTRIGVYEITAQIGAGGMGEVYRATDTKLKRQVAIKVLPPSLAADRDRLARFQREAEVLASVNHPNIAAIYGLEESAGIIALVMELVEGDDLSQRIARGAIPIDEALPIAKQTADALEAAHEQGIIHRDLKPANIKVRPDGQVKVLDFGLAKAMEPAAGSSPSLSMSPTITTPAMTQAGMILGTAAYMSPEQARGKTVDKRADIWAFGAVLYEMLTGARAFPGEDITDTLAAVVRAEPEWSLLPRDVSPTLLVFLRRSLQKDPKQRVGDIRDVRLALEGAFDVAVPHADVTVAVPATRRARWRQAPPWALVGALAAGLLLVLALRAPWRTAPGPTRLAFELPMGSVPAGGQAANSLAISSDGSQLVARFLDGAESGLLVRPLARVESVMLPNTDAATYLFWSPDGRAVGFFADGKLNTVDLGSATPRTLAEGTFGGTWNQDGVILFAQGSTSPIYRVAASGGPAVPVTALDPSRGETSHRFPRFLPDGLHFLYLVRSSNPETRGIYLGSLASKESHRLVDAVSKPEFAPPDLLLFMRESTLLAQRLDVRGSQLVGAPVRVAELIGSSANTGAAAFSVSDTGVLAYRTGVGGDVRELAWLDRGGQREGTIGTPAGYRNPRLSPDGGRLAVHRAEGGGDIWVTELDRGAGARFTLDPASDNVPLWSPDGTRIAFVSNRAGGVFDLYWKSAGGTGPEELLLKTPNNKLLNDWSPDGQYVLYQEDDPQTKTDLWMLPLAGDRKPARLLATPFNESEAAVSPDGRWMAYMSDESGGRHVYVQTFPISDRKVQVSTGRFGAHPRWSADGKELFFDAGGVMSAVSVSAPGPTGELRLGRPQPLFRGLLDEPPHNFDISSDGRRFLVLQTPNTGTQAASEVPVTVVVNWKSGLALSR